MLILLHSSKAMRTPDPAGRALGTPALLDQAVELIDYLRTLPPATVAEVMAVSAALAESTRELHQRWTPGGVSPAVDCFSGDIYSGLRSRDLSAADRDYAQAHLRILSGLYGILRPDDGICPYRLEMGYRFPGPAVTSMYRFWGDRIAAQVPGDGPIINLTATEYGKTVTKYLPAQRFLAPKFLTVSPKTGEPTFVTVHAKIARGTFARWLITSRVRDLAGLREFAEIGYAYDPERSSPAEPVFVCTAFGGKGLSVRLDS